MCLTAHKPSITKPKPGPLDCLRLQEHLLTHLCEGEQTVLAGMASWNIKSHLTRRSRQEQEEVRGLIASLPLRYRQHHVMYTWGATPESQDGKDDWDLDPPQQQRTSAKENKYKTSKEKPKKKRRFLKGSLSNVNDDEDVVRKKNHKCDAKNINQIRTNANGDYHHFGKHVRRAEFDYNAELEGGEGEHKYLLHFLQTYNNSAGMGQLFKSLSDPELHRTGSDGQSRYTFPLEGRHYDVDKMSKYVEKKKRSREEFPLGEISPTPTQPAPVVQQERELETCEIRPEQFFLY